jgi:hypothetical protein
VGAYRPVIWTPYSLTGSAVHAWIEEQLVACRPETRGGWGSGTLGYGGHGNVPGYYGFGLGYHLGYGYGGHGLGVGAEGGYPYYGGPGYRCGGQFYDGGPAYSGVANALIRPDDPAQAIAGMGDDPSHGGYHGDFGPFTGASPYPYNNPSPTAGAAATGPVNAPAGGVGPSLPDPTAPGPAAALEFGTTSANVSPAPVATIPLPATARDLGIDEQPVAGADGVRGLRVTRVYPGTATARAGLQPGDIILSSNGYLTEQPGNLTWIIAHAAPDKVLKMKIRRAGDGTAHLITAPLSAESLDMVRPPYLPPVSPGPPPATR